MEQSELERLELPETPLDPPQQQTSGTHRAPRSWKHLTPRLVPWRRHGSVDPAAEPAEKVPPTRAKRIRRIVFRSILVALVVMLTLLGVSVGKALTRAGNDSTAARLAEWGRDHHLGSTIDWLERKSYHPPKVGGDPKPTSPLVADEPLAAQEFDFKGYVIGATLPPAVVPLASPALADEGVWHPLASANGQTVMASAFLRPDALHTAYTAGMVWWNPSFVKSALHPGTLDPGGTWSEPNQLAPDKRDGILAAFNSGFRLDASRGGYYADKRAARPLRDGAASMIFYADGSMSVGMWGRDATLTPDVVSVRQNLALLVDGGVVVPGVENNVDEAWGATIGNAKYVWRSGIGVRPDGGMVYIASNRLTAQSLGQLLVQAGCLRGMELDINPDWTSFVRYTTPQPENLLPDMQNSPRRYDSPSSRDFVSLATK